jgi:hypothetical protein
MPELEFKGTIKRVSSLTLSTLFDVSRHQKSSVVVVFLLAQLLISMERYRNSEKGQLRVSIHVAQPPLMIPSPSLIVPSPSPPPGP